MWRAWCSVVVFVVAISTQSLSVPRIILDGEFEDWASVPVAVRDPLDSAPGMPDIRAAHVTADDHYLYLLVEFEHEVGLQSLVGTALSVLIDYDADPSTGGDMLGQTGIDLVIDAGQGVSVRSHDTGQKEFRQVPLIDSSFLFAPRVASRQFEFRLDRSASRTARVKLSLGQGPNRHDEVEPINVSLPERAVPAPATTARVFGDDPLRRPSDASFRVVVWNTSGLPSTERAAYLRILRAVDADVVLLDEVGTRRAPRAFANWFDDLRPDDSAWSVIVGRSFQGTAVAVRGRVEPAFDGVSRHAPAADALLATFPADSRPMLRTIFEEDKVGATGALAAIGRRRVLAVPVDLTSGGGADTFNEASRLQESLAIGTAVRQALSRSRPDAVIIAGDFNLVGSREPIEALLRGGLDVDGSPLVPARVLQLNGRTNATWRPISGGRFSAGQLDWVLYGDATLVQAGGFVFDTADLPDYWLTHHQLRATDSARTSDHLPVVVDFKWRR